MDITINCAALVRELGIARKLGERKTTIPVYAFSKLEAVSSDGDRAVALSATEGESAYQTRMGATVHQPGTALIPTRTLHEIARNAPAAEIRLTHTPGKLRATSGKFAAQLPTLPADDFPDLPAPIPPLTHVPAAALAAALARVRFVVESASAKGATAFTHGACFEGDGATLSLIATDGYRIAKSTMPTAGAAFVDPIAVTLPRKALADLSALLDVGDAEASVAYGTDGVRAYAQIGDRVYLTQVMDLAFVNYRRFVPKGTPEHRIEVDRDVLRGLLKRVTLVANDTAIRASFVCEGDTLRATMRSPEIGTVEDEVLVTVAGGRWSAFFDAKRLAEFAAAADAGLIVIGHNGPRDPASFTAPDGYLYVMAPMQDTEAPAVKTPEAAHA